MVGECKLHCRIEKGDGHPEFVINCADPPFSKREEVCIDVVKAAFVEIGYQPKRKWSGLEFFGLCRPDQISALRIGTYLCANEENVPLKPNLERDMAHPLAKKVMDNAHRNAGPTSSLNPPAQAARNKFIDSLVDFTSFGDIASKLMYSPCTTKYMCLRKTFQDPEI